MDNKKMKAPVLEAYEKNMCLQRTLMQTRYAPPEDREKHR